MTGLLFVALLFAVIALLFAIGLGSGKLIEPKRLALEPRHHEMLASPAEHGLELEPFAVTTHDGYELEAILANLAKVPGRAEKTRRMMERLGQRLGQPAAAPPGTVVFLHGRGGRKEDMLSLAQRFVAGGYRCVVYDARAHGKSGGFACTYGHHETRDLSAVLDRVTEMLKLRGELPGQICAVGNSLGAAVLLQALPAEPRIDVAIAVSPFATLPEIVTRSTKRTIHPWIPQWLIDASMLAGGRRAGFDPFAISPLREMSVATTPVFFAHGALDAVIPLAHSERLHAAAPEPKRLRIVPAGYHYNVLAEGGDDLYQEMIEFCLEQR
jgi:alpha-beta hydrolase superfamily lysophospholipase